MERWLVRQLASGPNRTKNLLPNGAVMDIRFCLLRLLDEIKLYCVTRRRQMNSDGSKGGNSFFDTLLDFVLLRNNKSAFLLHKKRVKTSFNMISKSSVNDRCHMIKVVLGRPLW